MRKIILIVAINCMYSYMCFGQMTGPIFTYGSSNNVIKNDVFISSLQPGDYNNITPFISKADVLMGSIMGVGDFSVKLSRYKGWENEAGDFDVINILKNNQSILELRDGLNSWSKLKTDFESFSANKYFVIVRLSSDAVALIFMGPSYDSTPALLTIVIIDKNQATLVFNKHMDINSIIKTDTTFSMVVQSNVVGWINPTTPETPAITHHIWLEGGVLRFKNN